MGSFQGKDKGGLRVGRDKDQGESQDVTLERTGVEDGIVLPMIMGWHWSTLDPSDLSRARYMEEVAAELGTPIEGEERSKPHPKRY
ncbi:MAG: hypothetical protein H0Z38_05250 [Firmicutes bacterium]|nr:hypothetical protein [Bacillota bacterium]